jgi:hypothetical protein
MQDILTTLTLGKIHEQALYAFIGGRTQKCDDGFAKIRCKNAKRFTLEENIILGGG